MDISKIRAEYSKKELIENNVSSEPNSQFEIWFDEALKGEVIEPNAMHLATIGENSRPTARIVLLKYFDDNGFCFFTNFKSKKGQDLERNPFGALTFFWPELERQVRIEGIISKMPESDSIKYFEERPRKSQIGAWASPQSKTIKNRTILEENFVSFEDKFEGKIVPKPEHWGGYCLSPDYFEFWQGRRSRLHDRIIYILNENKSWEIKRLAP